MFPKQLEIWYLKILGGWSKEYWGFGGMSHILEKGSIALYLSSWCCVDSHSSSLSQKALLSHRWELLDPKSWQRGICSLNSSLLLLFWLFCCNDGDIDTYGIEVLGVRKNVYLHVPHQISRTPLGCIRPLFLNSMSSLGGLSVFQGLWHRPKVIYGKIMYNRFHQLTLDSYLCKLYFSQ